MPTLPPLLELLMRIATRFLHVLRFIPVCTAVQVSVFMLSIALATRALLVDLIIFRSFVTVNRLEARHLLNLILHLMKMMIFLTKGERI